MKTTIIYLGLVALSFTNTIVANELKEQGLDKQQELNSVVLENSMPKSLFMATNQQILKDYEVSDSDDTAIFNPNSVIKTSNEKKIEEIIAENKLVTETIEEIYRPILLEKTIEESITEFNQIIESNDTNEVYPLDFEKINSSLQSLKVSNNKATVIIDLKL